MTALGFTALIVGGVLLYAGFSGRHPLDIALGRIGRPEALSDRLPE